jgi:c-di-GMP-binding flagellar brake protein YcgR
VTRRGPKRKATAEETPPLPAEGAVVDLVMSDRDRRWISRVEWTQRHFVCVIAPLRQDGEAVPLPVGTTLLVGWPTDLGFLQATSTLRGLRTDVVVTWILEVTAVARQQRRSSYRLDLTAPVTVRTAGRETPGRTCDVSEGGVRCSQPRRFAPGIGETVDLELELPDGPPVLARATVIRHHDVSPGEVEIGLRFVMIDADEAERLRLFIFEEQLRRRSLGT